MTGENICGLMMMVCAFVTFTAGTILFNRPAPKAEAKQAEPITWTNVYTAPLVQSQPETFYDWTPPPGCAHNYVTPLWSTLPTGEPKPAEHQKLENVYIIPPRHKPEDFVLSGPEYAPPPSFQGEHRWQGEDDSAGRISESLLAMREAEVFSRSPRVERVYLQGDTFVVVWGKSADFRPATLFRAIGGHVCPLRHLTAEEHDRSEYKDWPVVRR